MSGPRAPEATAIRRFCCALAGSDAVSPRLAAAAVDRSRQRFGAEAVDRLMQAFEAGGLEAVRRHPQVGAARALTHFLYTGLLPDKSGERSPEQTELDEADYFEAVMWRVIQAHPRALSGGYYGHWHYPPEDAAEDDPEVGGGPPGR